VVASGETGSRRDSEWWELERFQYEPTIFRRTAERDVWSSFKFKLQATSFESRLASIGRFSETHISRALLLGWHCLSPTEASGVG